MKKFNSFLLDPIDYTLLRINEKGQIFSVQITAKAFDVLRYFVEHPGRLVTHQELLETLWAGVGVQPEVLKGHVLAIRTALEDDAHKPRYLETHRGRGYRFIAPVENVLGSSPEPKPSASSLIGREKPWAQLSDAADRSVRGKTNVVFVRGDAGIGKTTLVENFCKNLGRRHAAVAYGRCIEGFAGVEPFYPVIDALAKWVKGEEADRIQDALLSHAPSWAALLGGLLSRERRTLLLRTQNINAKGRVIGEFCELLEFLSESTPVVLWLDDVHWADFATLDLISALARRQSSRQILIICTLRSDDLSDRSATVKQLLDDLQLHRLCSVIDLKGLNEQDVAQYIGEEHPSKNGEFSTYLQHRSGGNPLFLSIILDHLLSIGAVSLIDGRWTYDGLISKIGNDIPPTINDLVESKIAKIDDDSRRALEAASAVGDSFNVTIPAGAADLSIWRFEEICENLSRSGNFIVRQKIELPYSAEKVHIYKFKHSLYRDVFLSRQGPLRLAHTHAMIAQALEISHPFEGESHVPFELAEQFSDAGDGFKAISYLRMALQTAKRRFAHRDALTILDKADTVVSNVSEDVQTGIQLQLMEDRASIYAANHDGKALEVFTRMAETAALQGRTDILARAELGRAFSLSWTDNAGCLEHLKSAYELSHGENNLQLRARIRLASGIWRIWIGGWSKELSTIVEANLRPLRNGDDRQITAWGLIEYSIICLVSSHYREALETMEENVGILVRHAFDRPEFNVFRAIWMTHLGRPWAYIFLGEWGRALTEFDVSEKLFVANANRYSICTLETLRGFLYLMAGDHQGVRDICTKLGFYKDRNKEVHNPLYSLALTNEIRHCTLLAGAADVGLGNAEEGIHMLKKLGQDMQERPVIMDWYWRFLQLWVLAGALVDVGRVDEARSYADEMVRSSQQTEEGTWKLLALELRVRIALIDEDMDAAFISIERAMDIVENVGAPLAEWRIHKVVSEVYHMEGNIELAQFHERQFDASTQVLVESLPKDHELRKSFLRLIHAAPENNVVKQ